MSTGDVLGTLLLAAALAALVLALARRVPLRPYVLLALLLLIADVALRSAAPVFFTADPDVGLVHAINPVEVNELDLDWPNRVVAFLVVGLAVWLTARPHPRSRVVGIGLACAVPGGLLNLIEPMLRGYTTDYLAIGGFAINLADGGLALGLPIMAVGVVVGEVMEGWRSRRGAGDSEVKRGAAVGAEPGG